MFSSFLGPCGTWHDWAASVMAILYFGGFVIGIEFALSKLFFGSGC